MTPELSRLVGRVVNGPLLITLGPREQHLLTAACSKAHSVDDLPGRQRTLVRAHLRAFPGDEVEDHVGYGVLGSPAHNVENYDKDEPRGQGGRWESGVQYDKGNRVTSSIDPHEHVQIHDSATGEIYWHGPRHEADSMLREQSEVEPDNTLRIVPYDQSAHTAQQALEEVRRRQHDGAAAEAQRQEALKTPFGLLPGHRDYVEPPSTLYHATLDPDKIATGGFKSSDELGYQTLGGSSSHLVSFTTKANAEKYAQALDIARKAAHGKLGDDDLVKVGQRYGVSEEKMHEILDRSEGARDKSFSVLQSVSMEGKQFPLFMGTSWPQHLKTAGPPALVSIPSSDVKSIYYNPGEHEWRLGDLSNLKPTLVKNEDPSRFGLLPVPPPPVFAWVDTAEVQNFDPDQPRGEHGKWTTTGGGLGGSHHDFDVGVGGYGKEVLKEMMPGATTHDVALAAGALPGASINISTSRSDPSNGWPAWMLVKIVHDDYTASRMFLLRGGTLFIKNESMEVNEKGTGVGTRALAQQIEHCRRLGVKYMKAECVGDSKDLDYNGYYTWARMGYDGKLPDSHVLRSYMRSAGIEADTVHGLMSQPGGREIWKKHGSDFDGVFDLDPSSRSSRVFDAYLKERAKSGQG